MMPCTKCGLRYSSYCIGCAYVKHGLGLSDKEYLECLKCRSEVQE